MHSSGTHVHTALLTNDDNEDQGETWTPSYFLCPFIIFMDLLILFNLSFNSDIRLCQNPLHPKHLSQIKGSKTIQCCTEMKWEINVIHSYEVTDLKFWNVTILKCHLVYSSCNQSPGCFQSDRDRCDCVCAIPPRERCTHKSDYLVISKKNAYQ